MIINIDGISGVDLANNQFANDDGDEVHFGVDISKSLNDEVIEDPERFD